MPIGGTQVKVSFNFNRLTDDAMVSGYVQLDFFNLTLFAMLFD